MSRSYVDRSGNRVALGRELGRGGEGAVFEISGQNSLVAKIYHQSPDQSKSAKISAMAQAKTPELLKLTAWPIDVLTDSRSVVGLVMPKIGRYRDLHKLYGPKSRLSEFPDAGWDFLVHTAANVARAFAIVHESGHVIGDVNHGNVVAAADGTVRLIDCDSFQVSYGGKTYSCDVGVLTHQPPELQSISSFRGVSRTSNYDNFGLAVLIFQLLFMARHPFSGRFSGSGEMPVERAIKEFRFAYGSSAHARQMKAPPGALTLSAVSQSIALLFERAFSPEGQWQRPRANEWVQALDDMKRDLRKCSANPNHSYLSALGTCPLCAIERTAGVILFLPPFGVDLTKGGTFNLAAIWSQIDAITRPGPIPNIPKPSVAANVTHLGMSRGTRTVAACTVVGGAIAAAAMGVVQGPAAFWLIAIACLIGWLFYFAGKGKLRSEVKAKYQAARSEHENTVRRLEAEGGTAEFDRKRRELVEAKVAYQGLADARRKGLAKLEANKRAVQLEHFLDQFEIEDAKISGVGPGRKTVLESHGIETAADITREKILGVPGFGEKTADRLLAWRRQMEARFVFNPAKELDRSAVAALDRDIANTRLKLEGKLIAGLPELRRIQQTALAKRNVLVPRLEQAAKQLAQAEANMNAV